MNGGGKKNAKSFASMMCESDKEEAKVKGMKKTVSKKSNKKLNKIYRPH